MAGKTKLTTDWVRIGTSGFTVDGREISPQDIKDMADTYNQEEYAAVINYEHFRYFGSFGTVVELKAEKNGKGEMVLLARLEPNKYMLQMNNDGQKMFTSMEIAPNFARTGKAYLVGLALTDSPASRGTTQLHFSHRVEEGKYLTPPEELHFTLEEDEQEPGWVTKLLSSIKAASKGGEPDPKEDNEMTEEQYEKLFGAIETLGTNFSALADKLQPAATDGDGKDEPAGDKPNAPAGESFSAEQAKALQDSVTALSDQVKDLTEKFNTAINTPAGDTTPPAQGNEGQEKVL